MDSTDAIVASKLKAKPVHWLYRRHIPQGMITVVAGKPDQGKGLFCAHVAAEVSRRGDNVLYSAAEDDPARMTKPRLEAADAALDHVLVWRFALPRQWKELRNLIAVNDIKLVVMDPLASHLSGGVRRHSDGIRTITNPMCELGEETGVTFLIVEHALKRISKYMAPISMIGGTGSGLAAAARAAYLMGVDPKDADRRVLCPAKLNVAEWPKSLAFETDVAELDDVAEVPYLLFQEETEMQAGALMATEGQHGGQPGQPPNKRAAAAEWLANYLFDKRKPVMAGLVLEDGKQIGLSVKTVKRAADDMGVIRKPPGGGRKCTWALPGEVVQMIAAARKASRQRKGGRK